MGWWLDIVVWTTGLGIAGFAYLWTSWMSRRLDERERNER